MPPNTTGSVILRGCCQAFALRLCLLPAAGCLMLRNSNTVAVEINLLYSKAEFMFFFFSVKKTNQTALEWQVKKNCFDVYIKAGSILSFPGWYIVQQLNNRTMDVRVIYCHFKTNVIVLWKNQLVHYRIDVCCSIKNIIQKPSVARAFFLEYLNT